MTGILFFRQSIFQEKRNQITMRMAKCYGWMPNMSCQEMIFMNLLKSYHK